MRSKGPIVTTVLVRVVSLVWMLIVSSCAGSGLKPREACFSIKASPSLNLYDGEAHALNLLLFPLTGDAAFLESSVDDLLTNKRIEGAAGPPISLMVSPSEKRRVRETFPPTTRSIGLVADYYQAGLDTPGNRRVIVPARCKRFGSDGIVLTGRDLLVD